MKFLKEKKKKGEKYVQRFRVAGRKDKKKEDILEPYFLGQGELPAFKIQKENWQKVPEQLNGAKKIATGKASAWLSGEKDADGGEAPRG